ncbi:MAG: hypothetical protein WB870_17020 [Gallionellaceae bacterium]
METINKPVGGQPVPARQNNPHANYRRYPAFGKQMMQLREAGQVPPNSVCVCFDWDLAQQFPRIVIADPVAPDDLELRYLAGLDVWIAYRDKDAAKVSELAQAILQTNPHSLLAFNIEARKNTILKTMTGEARL